MAAATEAPETKVKMPAYYLKGVKIIDKLVCQLGDDEGAKEAFDFFGTLLEITMKVSSESKNLKYKIGKLEHENTILRGNCRKFLLRAAAAEEEVAALTNKLGNVNLGNALPVDDETMDLINSLSDSKSTSSAANVTGGETNSSEAFNNLLCRKKTCDEGGCGTYPSPKASPVTFVSTKSEASEYEEVKKLYSCDIRTMIV